MKQEKKKLIAPRKMSSKFHLGRNNADKLAEGISRQKCDTMIARGYRKNNKFNAVSLFLSKEK